MPIGTDVEAAIDALVRQELAGVRVASVRVTEPDDDAGAEALDISVIFEDPAARIGSDVRVRLLGKMRNALLQQGEPRFPLPRFLTRSEAEELGVEA